MRAGGHWGAVPVRLCKAISSPTVLFSGSLATLAKVPPPIVTGSGKQVESKVKHVIHAHVHHEGGPEEGMNLFSLKRTCAHCCSHLCSNHEHLSEPAKMAPGHFMRNLLKISALITLTPTFFSLNM